MRLRDPKNEKDEKKSKKKPGLKNPSTDNLGNIFEIFGDDNPRQKTQPEENKKFKTRPRSGREGQNSGTAKLGNMSNGDNIYNVLKFETQLIAPKHVNFLNIYRMEERLVALAICHLH